MFIRLRAILTFGCVLALLLSVMPISPQAMAQESVTGTASGVSVTAGGGWNHDAAASRSEGGVDSLVFTNGSAQFVVSGGTTDMTTSFTLLGISQPVSDIDLTSTYALRGVDANGTPFGVFQVAVGNTVQSVVAPVSGFGSAMADAQANIQVDGVAVMSGVDGNSLAGTIAGNVGSGDTDADASAPALLGSGDASADTIGDVVPGEATAEASDTATTEDATVASEATDAAVDTAPASGETGFLDDNTWVSPMFGATLTWNENWTPRTDFEGNPISTSYESSSAEYNHEQVCLNSLLDEFSGEACIRVQPYREDGFGRFWGPNAVPQETSFSGTPYFAVVLTESGGSRASFNLLGSGYVEDEFRSGDLIVSTWINAWGDVSVLPPAVAAAQEGIQVDGTSVFSTQDATIFQQETDAAIASIPNLQAERDTNMASMGLIGDHHFVSNAMGCDVEWSESHGLNDSTMDPIRQGEDWDQNSNPMPYESMQLFPTNLGNTFNVRCFAGVSSLQSIYEFNDFNTDVVVIEGNQVHYAILDFGDGVPEITIVPKPVDGPIGVVSLYSDSEGLTAIEPGMLIVNGVDIGAAIAEDDLANKLP